MLSNTQCTTNTNGVSVGVVIEATLCAQPATNELCRMHGVMIKYLVDVRHIGSSLTAISLFVRMDILINHSGVS